MVGHTNTTMTMDDEPQDLPIHNGETHTHANENGATVATTSTGQVVTVGSSCGDTNFQIITEVLITPPLNPNTYASKKSLAQGMLDLALLAANATQLKYILKTGDSHEFYGLLLTLVILSICLQLLQSILCIVLGLIFDINKVDQQKSANIVNNVGLSIVIIVVVINVMISAFDIKAIENRREPGPLIN